MLIAALPPAEPPARTVAGVKITWPLSAPQSMLAPGSRLVVRVSSPRRRSQLSFVRVDAQGRPLRMLARRTLRSGSFKVTVPAAVPGARFALRLSVAGRKHFSWIRVAAPASPSPAPVTPVVPTPTPTPSPAPLAFCREGEPPPSAYKSELRLTTTMVAAGATLDYTVVNTGEAPIVDAGNGRLESVLGSGTNWSGPTVAVGASAAHSIVIPADTAPGIYRLNHDVSWAHCDTVATQALRSEPFEVTP